MHTGGKFTEIVKQDGDLVIGRQGVAEAFRIPEKLKGNFLFEADIDDNGHIVMNNGETIQILTDKFGLMRNNGAIDVNLFFVDGGMVIELISGTVILEASNGELYAVDELGDISYPASNRRIEFRDYNWVREMSSIVVGNRYGVSSAEAGTYVDNLLLNMIFDFASGTSGEPYFSARVQTQYEDLGLDKFPFVNLKAAAWMFVETEDEPFDMEKEYIDETEEKEEVFVIGLDDDEEDF